MAILALAVTSKNATFMCKAICFFLNVEEKMAMDQKRAKELMQFITERCTEDQMAAGINKVRATCARVPSVLSKDESKEITGATVMDIKKALQEI